MNVMDVLLADKQDVCVSIDHSPEWFKIGSSRCPASIRYLLWRSCIDEACFRHRQRSRPLQHSGAVNSRPALAEEKAAKDIVDTAVSAGRFKTLVTAVKAADLVETLKGKGPFTVFAPTDEAFGKVPQDKLEALLKDKKALRAVLTYHVVSGQVMAADVVKLDSAKTVQGQSIQIVVKDGKVMVNGAKVLKTDIVCGNGVIHVIDAVLLPPCDK